MLIEQCLWSYHEENKNDVLYLGFLPPQFADQKLTILEAGCGVGNCLFPLLEEDLNIFAYACDFSPRAVEYVKVGVMFEISFRVSYEASEITSDWNNRLLLPSFL